MHWGTSVRVFPYFRRTAEGAGVRGVGMRLGVQELLLFLLLLLLLPLLLRRVALFRRSAEAALQRGRFALLGLAV